VNAPRPTTGARPASGAPKAKSARRRSRELALQGLYQWQIGKQDPAEIDANLREQDEFGKADAPHLDALLHGCIQQHAMLDPLFADFLDRPLHELSPIEHAILWIGTFELKQCLDIPYKVVINESVELAKSFGGTDGHKYVNGILDQTAQQLRPGEVHKR
jgi:transcription antitermination protein NusB